MVFARKNTILSKVSRKSPYKTFVPVSQFKFQNEDETSRGIQLVEIRRKRRRVSTSKNSSNIIELKFPLHKNYDEVCGNHYSFKPELIYHFSLASTSRNNFL